MALLKIFFGFTCIVIICIVVYVGFSRHDDKSEVMLDKVSSHSALSGSEYSLKLTRNSTSSIAKIPSLLFVQNSIPLSGGGSLERHLSASGYAEVPSIPHTPSAYSNGAPSVLIPARHGYAVPNVIHYTWYHPTKLVWRFHHMMCLLAAHRFQKPDRIYFWYELHPQGPYWNQTISMVPNIEMIYRKGPTHIFGRKINVPQHRTDVVRLEAVMNYGGIYTDLDVIMVKSMDPLRVYNTTMGLEKVGGLGNGVILGRAGADFLKIMYDSYHTFNDGQWATHSVHLPAKLAKKHPKLIHVEERSFHRPNYLETYWFYKEGKIVPNLTSDHYCFHTYFNKYRVDHNLTSIRKFNTTIGMLFRLAYYGSTDFIN